MKIFYAKSIMLLDKFIVRVFPYKLYEKIQSFLGYPVINARFKIRLGYPLDLKNPQTFNEKVVHNLLFNKDPLYPIIADKFAVRSYIKHHLGEEYLIPLVDAVDDPEELDFEKYPNQFIIKTNFTSGGNILVKDKSKIDIPTTIHLLKRWTSQKYGASKLLWFAQDMPRKIIVEELIEGGKNEIPNDYKFFCFNQKVRCIQVDTQRFTNHARSLYTPEWELLEVGYFDSKVKRTGVPIDKPENLLDLIEVAEKLASPFHFMRVDLYSVDEKIYFGEFTPNPINGNGKFVPESFDYELGKIWKNTKV